MWWIILVIVILIVLYVISTYNLLVRLRNKVRDGWSQIDFLLKRRAYLIPNLVETVKVYAKHEEGTLTAVIEARSKAVGAKTPEEAMKAEGAMTQALSRLFALAESYPALKANQNFLDLQKSLEETENKITYSRQFYNDNVLNYNNKVEMFPSNLVAGLFKFEKAVFFEASEKDKEAPKVQF